MRVSVDTNDTSGQVLNKKTPAQPAYSTNIFENELKDANDVVEQVISANDDRGQYAKHLKP
jgi:membrane fusion protein (multidrug efflux system)